MFREKKVIAIIPARSGSKGLVDKNIKCLNGKPMIAYTIEAAVNSGVFDEIVVSTDSLKYKMISEKYGASVPFIRPEILSNDTANTVDVIIHALDYYCKENSNFDYFMLLQPTSPLRDSKDIISALELLIEKKANSVVSVSEVDHCPLWSNTLGADLKLDDFLPITNTRRQDLPTYYRLNGAIYIAEIEYYRKTMDFYEENSFAYIMNKSNSIDIDVELDFIIAEAVMNTKKN